MTRYAQLARRLSGLLLIILAAPLHAEPTSSEEQFSKKVIAAFREIVRIPAKSTVQIFCDGYRTALGTVVRQDGYIVTKASELKGNVQVQLNDTKMPQKFEALVVARDKETDLALLKINAKGLPVISWRDGATPPVGSWLVTPGLKSELEPLAIGVLSVGARKISAPSGALGILVDEVADVLRVKHVSENSPASQAGIAEGDIIRKVNGTVIKDRAHGQETIRSHQPGDSVELTIDRSGTELTIRATLGSLSILMNGERAEFQNQLGGRLSERRAGFPLAIQHDSVLRPGDCGGPIVDLEGKAIGLNIARAGRVESYALPASVVRETLEKLLPPEAATGDDMLVGKSGASESSKKVH